MTSTTNAIVNENNKTLAFIEAKEYSSAVQSSLSALSFLQRASFPVNSSHSEEASTSITLDQCMMLRSKEAFNDEFSSEDDVQRPFVFDQGILLPPTITDLTVIAPALIFNSALAHHLPPNTDHAESPSTLRLRLQKAKRLYGLAYGAAEMSHNSVLFRFVLVNNLAVIDREIGNMEQSERSFQSLMSMYLLFLDQQNTLKVRYVQGFLSNLSVDHNYSAAA